MSNFLLNSCISLWILAWLSTISEKLLWEKGSNLLTQVSSDVSWQLASATLISLAFVKHLSGRDNRRHKFKSGIFSRSVIFMAVAAASLPCIVSSGGKFSAIIISDFVSPTVAESLFRGSRDRLDLRWHHSVGSYRLYGSDDRKDSNALAEAVRTTYGESSGEIAAFKVAKASACLSEGKVVSAISLCKESLSMFQNENDAPCKAYIWIMLTDCYLKQQNDLCAEQACAQALGLIANLSDEQLDGNDALERLSCFSRQMGFAQEGKCLSERIIQINKNSWVLKFLIPMLMTCLGTIVIPNLIDFCEQRCDDSKVVKWKKMLACSRNVRTTFVALDMLTSLEMRRGNFEEADKFSRELLKVALLWIT